MTRVVMDNIPFDPDVNALAAQLRVKPDSARMARLRDLVSEARAIARPKALYLVARLDARGDDYVVLNGTKFTSRVLQVNLAKVHRAFVCIATCGVEMEDWAQSKRDLLEQFQADAIAGAALMAAREALARHLEQVYQPGRLGEMNPGSLPDWPLLEQRPLFDLLGDSQRDIGVQLLDSYLMKPIKTTSGLLFPAEEGFHNCQLCPMEDCPGRRSPYDPGLYDRRYRPGATQPAGTAG